MKDVYEYELIESFVTKVLRSMNDEDVCSACGSSATDHYITDCCLRIRCPDCINLESSCNLCIGSNGQFIKEEILIHSVVEFIILNKNKGYVDGNHISPYDSKYRRFTLFCTMVCSLPLACLYTIEKSILALSKGSFETILFDSRWSECSSYLELLLLLITPIVPFSKGSRFFLMTTSSLLFLSPPISLFSMTDATGNGTIYGSRGDVYIGEMRMGRPWGNGTMRYFNGCWWTGQWENGMREGEGEYRYSELVWQKGVWHKNKQIEWKGIYLPSGRYDERRDLFDMEKGWFPFTLEKEVNLALSERDAGFMNCFLSNTLFIPVLFSSACQLHTFVCESSLSSSATTMLLDVLSRIPSLRDITLHNDTLQTLIIGERALRQIQRLHIECKLINNCTYTTDMMELMNIQFGRYSCSSLIHLTLQRLPRLQYIDIGFNALSMGDCRFPFSSDHVSSSYSFYSKQRKRIHFEDLPNLVSILLDNGASFHPLSTLDVPQLTDLLIGSDENMYNSYSFYCCAQLKLESLQALQTLDFGCFACYQTSRLVCTDLPSLISLSFGMSSFSKLTDLCLSNLYSIQSLSIGSNSMNSLPVLVLKDFLFLDHLSIGSDSCKRVRSIVLHNLPELHSIIIGDQSFVQTTGLSIEDLPNVITFAIGDRSFVNLRDVTCQSEYSKEPKQ